MKNPHDRSFRLALAALALAAAQTFAPAPTAAAPGVSLNTNPPAAAAPGYSARTRVAQSTCRRRCNREYRRCLARGGRSRRSYCLRRLRYCLRYCR